MKVLQQVSTSTTLQQGAANITSGKSSKTSTAASISSLASSPGVTGISVSQGISAASAVSSVSSLATLGTTRMIPITDPSISFSDVFEIDSDRGLSLLVDLLPGQYVDDQNLGVLSTEGDFTYQLRFFIDKTAAISNSVTKVVFKFFEDPTGTATSRETSGLRNTNLNDALSSVSMIKGRTAAYSSAVSALSTSPVVSSVSTISPATSIATSVASVSLTSHQLELISSTSATGYFKEVSVDLSSYLGIDEIPSVTELAGGVLASIPITYTFGVSTAATPTAVSEKITKGSHTTITSQIDLKPKALSVNPFNNAGLENGNGLTTSTTSVTNRMSSNAGVTAVQNSLIDPAALGQLSFSGATISSAMGTSIPGLGSMGASSFSMGNVTSTGINSVATMQSLPNPVAFGVSSPISNLNSNLGSLSIGNDDNKTVLNSTAMSNFSQDLFSNPITDLSAPIDSISTLSLPASIASVSIGEIQSELIEIIQNVSFGIDFLAQREKFYVVVELMGDNGATPIATKEFSVLHRDMLIEFLYPSIPPAVSCTLSLGDVNNIMITQRDPIGTHVRIERKIVDPDNMDNGFQVIEDKILVTPSMGSIIYTDRDANCYNPKSAIYRVTPIGPTGGEGTTFGWTVVNGVPVPEPVKKSDSKYSVVLSAENSGDGIKIELSNISEAIQSITLLKKCYSLRGFPSHSEYTRIPIQGKTVYNLPEGKKSVTVFDKSVVSNYEYLYQCEVHPRGFASSEVANGYALKEYIAPVRDNAAASIDGFTYDKTIGGIKYNLSSTPSEQSYQSIQNLLKLANVAESFIEDLNENRSRLDEMIMFHVSRFNLSSGKKYSYGIYPPGKFEDSAKVQGEKNIPALEPGVTYRYVNELMLTPPEILFKDAVTKISTQGLVETTTSVLSEKFYSSLLGDRRMPSQRELNDRSSSSEKQIYRGRTGIELSQEYTIPAIPPEILSISARKSCLGINNVTFTCSGDISRVDHFLVCCRYMGTTSVLGSVTPGQSKGSTYTFRDLQLSRELGDIEYFIILVINNYTKTYNPTKSATLSQSSDVPSILLSLKHAPKNSMPDNIVGVGGSKAGSHKAARLSSKNSKSVIPGGRSTKTGKFTIMRDASGVSQAALVSQKSVQGAARVGSTSTKRRSSSASSSKPKKATASQIKSLSVDESTARLQGTSSSSRAKSTQSSTKRSSRRSSGKGRNR